MKLSERTTSPTGAQRKVTSSPSSAPPLAVRRRAKGFPPTLGALTWLIVIFEEPCPGKRSVTALQPVADVLILCTVAVAAPVDPSASMRWLTNGPSAPALKLVSAVARLPARVLVLRSAFRPLQRGLLDDEAGWSPPLAEDVATDQPEGRSSTPMSALLRSLAVRGGAATAAVVEVAGEAGVGVGLGPVVSPVDAVDAVDVVGVVGPLGEGRSDVWATAVGEEPEAASGEPLQAVDKSAARASTLMRVRPREVVTPEIYATSTDLSDFHPRMPERDVREK